MDLTDTKGYRAKYINALNEASKRHRVVGGDVTPLETDGGTLLRIPALAETCRFQLFVGATEILDKPITPTFCVADGSFFVAGELIKLKSCTNTVYKKEGICPTSSGWALKAEGKDGWKTCDVEILKYEETYYLGFHFDNEKRYPLISDTATEEIESQISVVVKIGTFNAPITDTTIVQIVKTDIFYGGGGGVVDNSPKPFEIRLLGYKKLSELKYEGIFGVYNGAWQMVDWATKEQLEEAGVSSNGAPKLVYAVKELADNDGYEIIKSSDGYEFFDISLAVNTEIREMGEIGKPIYVRVSRGKAYEKDDPIGLNYDYAPAYASRVFAGIKIAEITLTGYVDNIMPQYRIRTFVGDIVATVQEEGVKLYAVTENSSGKTYENAYNTQFDANKQYVLASFLNRVTQQGNSRLNIEEMPDAFCTMIPCMSHAVDHLGGIV